MMHGFIALHKAPTAEKSFQAWADAVKLLQSKAHLPVEVFEKKKKKKKKGQD